jgi:hypothetical protein
MDYNAHVKRIIDKYAVRTRTPEATAAAQAVYLIIKGWAHKWLLEVTYSGSSAKGTAIRGVADVDLFISLSPDTPGTLSDLYNNLANYKPLQPLSPRRQNVSIGIKHSGCDIDLVPARKQQGNGGFHSLYRSKARTWTQTNVSRHIKIISESQRLDEIRATKIWRALHGLDFPSFYLELTVLDALHGKPVGNLANNFVAVLQYLRDDFESAAVVDPANSNNCVSDDLTIGEKNAIATKAEKSLRSPWTDVLW